MEVNTHLYKVIPLLLNRDDNNDRISVEFDNHYKNITELNFPNYAMARDYAKTVFSLNHIHQNEKVSVTIKDAIAESDKGMALLNNINIRLDDFIDIITKSINSIDISEEYNIYLISRETNYQLFFVLIARFTYTNIKCSKILYTNYDTKNGITTTKSVFVEDRILDSLLNFYYKRLKEEVGFITKYSADEYLLYNILREIRFNPNEYKEYEIDFVKNDHLIAVKTEDDIVKTMIDVSADLSDTNIKELLYSDANRYRILIGGIRIGERNN